jgi:hypothetical protein
MTSYVSEDDWGLWSSWRGVNEGSDGNKISFKHCNRKINLRQHHD